MTKTKRPIPDHVHPCADCKGETRCWWISREQCGHPTTFMCVTCLIEFNKKERALSTESQIVLQQVEDNLEAFHQE